MSPKAKSFLQLQEKIMGDIERLEKYCEKLDRRLWYIVVGYAGTLLGLVYWIAKSQ